MDQLMPPGAGDGEAMFPGGGPGSCRFLGVATKNISCTYLPYQVESKVKRLMFFEVFCVFVIHGIEFEVSHHPFSSDFPL